MKKISIICAVACVMLSFNASVFAGGDWRKGIYNRDVSENLLSVGVEAVPVITEAFSSTTPWALGFNAGFEHKMRPSIIHNKVSFGYGLHSGVTRYFGKHINTTAAGNELQQQWDKYKSYTQIPLMLDLNIYYNFSRSNIFAGVSAGVNFMLGERDARVDSIGPSITSELEDAYNLAHGKDVDFISIQLNENNVSLTHVIPTFRFHLGYVYEISPDLRLRAVAGIEYQMKYEDEYRGVHIDATYLTYYHQHNSPQMLNPFISLGISYSL
ncbi:MAG: hypothetical protein IJ250_06835 [Bacteroidales bacterium]|nr:hypothetical protein [Bacteroidales bacterium]MBQ7985333.1 hypothetical protein [Bacteroidales bacterium]